MSPLELAVLIGALRRELQQLTLRVARLEDSLRIVAPEG